MIYIIVYLVIGFIVFAAFIFGDWYRGRGLSLAELIYALILIPLWIFIFPFIVKELGLDEIVIIKGRKK